MLLISWIPYKYCGILMTTLSAYDLTVGVRVNHECIPVEPDSSYSPVYLHMILFDIMHLHLRVIGRKLSYSFNRAVIF